MEVSIINLLLASTLRLCTSKVHLPHNLGSVTVLVLDHSVHAYYPDYNMIVSYTW